MVKKVIVLGCRGRMGRLAVEALNKDPRFTVSQALSREDDLDQALEKDHGEIVVDLTLPDVVFDNAKKVLEKKKSLVIGASGLTSDQIDWLKSICAEREVCCAIIPNFSIACALMVQASKMIAPYIPDVEVIEYHHKQKKDAPSATAKHTAKVIKQSQSQAGLEHKQTVIPIHSIRNNGFVATQDVIFGQAGESLLLRHTTHDRLAFMPGLLWVCANLEKHKGLVIGLEKMLSISI